MRRFRKAKQRDEAPAWSAAGDDDAEDAVDVDLRRSVPTMGAGDIEQRRPGAAHVARSEADPPDARDGDGHPAAIVPGATARAVDVDAAAAEVRDEEVPVEPAEPPRREGETPVGTVGVQARIAPSSHA